MILTLTNFRCYKKTTFEFPDNGTVLLWGTSGIGKTTIFKAINFVLFDKELKVTTYGEKKCEVILKYKQYTITRRKNPNYLTIKNDNDNSLYDNDVAQSKIDELFGDNFQLTGYMPQKNSDKFFLMSNNEKATFLQSLSIKDFDIENFRRKVRDAVRIRKENLSSKTTEKKIIADNCKQYDIDENTNLIQPELKIDTKDMSIKDFIEEEQHKLEGFKKKLKEKRLLLDSKINLLRENEKLQETVVSKQQLLKHFEKRLEELRAEESNINDYSEEEIEELKDEIANYQNVIKILNIKQSYKESKEEYDNMIRMEEEKISSDIEKYTKLIKECDSYILDAKERDELGKLADDINKFQNVKKEMKSYVSQSGKNQELSDSSRIYSINSIVNGLKKLIEELDTEKEDVTSKLKELGIEIEKIQTLVAEEEINYKNLQKLMKEGEQHKYNCPKCKTGLMIHNNIIKEHNINIEELRKEESSLKKSLTEKKQKLSSFEKEKNTMEGSLREMQTRQKNLSSYIVKLKELSHIEGVSVSITDIKEKINNDMTYGAKHGVYKKELEKLERVKSLKPEVLPEHLAKKRENLLKVKKQYEKLKEEVKEYEPLPVREYEKMIVDNNTTLKNIQSERSALKKVREDIKNTEKNIYECQCYVSDTKIEDVENIKKEIETVRHSSEKLESNIEKLVKRDDRIKKYQKEVEVYQRNKKLQDKLLEVKSEESLCVRALSKSEELLKYVNEAESLSLSQTIQNINTDLEEFITAFFGDNFNVSLTTFKQTKEGDKKALIDVQIIKDGEVIPLDGLSGGEYDRVSLALFLAFNKASKCGIILLDECLASLHQELVEEMVELIKEKMSDKLVMFTLHQANTGIFDSVIDICKYRCF